MSAFALPAESTDTASLLRDLEQSAPNPTPKAIRAAMIQAAQELEEWRRLADDCARRLEEAAKLRAGQMDSQSRHDEIQRAVRSSILDVGLKLRARL